ncbi:unnamed protein product [Gadus morhua 'NCC']
MPRGAGDGRNTRGVVSRSGGPDTDTKVPEGCPAPVQTEHVQNHRNTRNPYRYVTAGMPLDPQPDASGSFKRNIYKHFLLKRIELLTSCLLEDSSAPG